MKFLILNNLLSRHKNLQFIFAFTSCVLVTIYCLFYLIDLANIFSIVEYNNKITQDNLALNKIHEVSSFSQNYDNTYNVVISGDNKTQVDVRYGELIYSISYIADDWYILNVSDGSSVYASSTDLMSEELGYSGVDVYLEDGSFRLVYADGLEKYVDTLSSVDVLVELESGCRLEVSSGYSLDLKEVAINYCTILPTDGIYYNEGTLSIVRNFADTFRLDFFLSSNIFVVTAFVGLWVVVLLMCRNTNLTILRSKYVTIVNIASVVMLVLCILLGYILLS